MPELTPQTCTCCSDILVRDIKTGEFAEGLHQNNEKVTPTSPTAVGERLLSDLKVLW